MKRGVVRLRLICIACVACITGPVGAAGKVLLGPLIEFPEVGMAIEQPHGFQKALSFHGLQNYNSGASVMLTAVPSAYSHTTARFFEPGAMTEHGMRLRSRASVRINGFHGLLLDVQQQANGTSYRKWILLFGGTDHTNMVTASFPHHRASSLGPMMRQVALSVLTARNSANKSSLPFQLGAVAGMTPVRSAAGAGRVALYTRDGRLEADNASDPLFIASPSAQSIQIADVDEFAKQRLHASGATQIDSVTSKRPVHVDGLPGIEITALGRDSQTNVQLSIYQMMLFPRHGGFVVMRGTVGFASREPYLTRFKKLARTYKSTR